LEGDRPEWTLGIRGVPKLKADLHEACTPGKNFDRMDDRRDPVGSEKSSFRAGGIILITLVLIAAVVIMVLRGQGDDRRSPSPTPTNENVHEIAP